jgi:predicted transcriptional regulator
MKILEIKKILEAEVLTGEDHLDREVFTAGASDLMSDVLAFGAPHSLQLTGLITNQVIYTCEMAQRNAIVFVRGKVPSDEVISLAKEKGFVVLATQYPLFESCGMLYKAGLLGTTISPIGKSRPARKTKKRT